MPSTPALPIEIRPPASAVRSETCPNDSATAVHRTKNGSQAAKPIAQRRIHVPRTPASVTHLAGHSESFTDEGCQLAEIEWID
jgi:hypothetical protein